MKVVESGGWGVIARVRSGTSCRTRGWRGYFAIPARPPHSPTQNRTESPSTRLSPPTDERRLRDWPSGGGEREGWYTVRLACVVDDAGWESRSIGGPNSPTPESVAEFRFVGWHPELAGVGGWVPKAAADTGVCFSKLRFSTASSTESIFVRIGRYIFAAVNGCVVCVDVAIRLCYLEFERMATLLPPVPWWVFCVYEPISTFAGLGYAVLSTEKFVAEQLPDVEASALTPQGTLVAWQTGNLFGIMAMMAIAVLWSTSEVAVVKRYLVALLVGDIGHLAAVWWHMGTGHFVGAHRWNVFTWGNVGVTAFLAVVRLGTLAGLFGGIGLQPLTKHKAR
ncbi:LOW QUALITY PROTEIN: hypothetical protein Dda_0293 [Drechslerella dactyloides]|uniref:DUF7704 domain-containing protein n=1 Tax=Drechslerella dactyloides TaxID=74499 RepID=A0AAD6J7P7_DREDA|nr:LOW QUALITY PROTEIN: hypothetical protein Dda_0293 [Drechslerella dactyloides]